jgi:hypothetical protein
MGALTLGGTAVDGTGFLPLAGDQTLVAGAQGGFLVWLKFRVGGVANSDLGIHRTARRVSDNHLLLTTDGTISVGQPGDDGLWELPTPYPTFLCPTPIGVSVIDEPIRFRVELSDNGTLLDAAENVATPHCPTDGEAQFCQNICAG